MKLFYDDEFDALAQTISNSDREFKTVAMFLFPHLGDRSAYARLKNCLNPERDERLSLGQVIAMCKFCGSFDAMHFMTDELSHARTLPVTKEDELARLLREYLEAQKVTQKLAPQIERLRAA